MNKKKKRSNFINILSIVTIGIFGLGGWAAFLVEHYITPGNGGGGGHAPDVSTEISNFMNIDPSTISTRTNDDNLNAYTAGDWYNNASHDVFEKQFEADLLNDAKYQVNLFKNRPGDLIDHMSEAFKDIVDAEVSTNTYFDDDCELDISFSFDENTKNFYEINTEMKVSGYCDIPPIEVFLPSGAHIPFSCDIKRTVRNYYVVGAFDGSTLENPLCTEKRNMLCLTPSSADSDISYSRWSGNITIDLIDVYNFDPDYTNGIAYYSTPVGILPRFQNGYRIFGISQFSNVDDQGDQASPYQDMGQYIDSYALENADISSINFNTSNDGNLAQDGATPSDFSFTSSASAYVSQMEPTTHANNFGLITIPHASLTLPADSKHFDIELTINKLSGAKPYADYYADVYSSISPNVLIGSTDITDYQGGEGTINMEIAGWYDDPTHADIFTGEGDLIVKIHTSSWATWNANYYFDASMITATAAVTFFDASPETQKPNLEVPENIYGNQYDKYTYARLFGAYFFNNNIFEGHDRGGNNYDEIAPYMQGGIDNWKSQTWRKPDTQCSYIKDGSTNQSWELTIGGRTFPLWQVSRKVTASAFDDGSPQTYDKYVCNLDILLLPIFKNSNTNFLYGTGQVSGPLVHGTTLLCEQRMLWNTVE